MQHHCKCGDRASKSGSLSESNSVSLKKWRTTTPSRKNVRKGGHWYAQFSVNGSKIEPLFSKFCFCWFETCFLCYQGNAASTCVDAQRTVASPEFFQKQGSEGLLGAHRPPWLPSVLPGLAQPPCQDLQSVFIIAAQMQSLLSRHD